MRLRSAHQRLLGTILLAVATSVSAPAAHPALIVGTPANRMAEDVLRTLLSTPMGQAAPPCPWSVVLVQSARVNAYIDGKGQITVTGGMAAAFGNERGLWAAVLGHEIGHFVIHRQLEAYLPRFQAALDQAYAAAQG
ncbi:MAG TPA: M48 family metalloprotease, partial [Terriglobia bacterium]|nr:M48 family metalloprotease [Terriglobia bacterium]